jgi:hypothetical protein
MAYHDRRPTAVYAPRTLHASDDGRARICAVTNALPPKEADAAFHALLRDTEWQRVEAPDHCYAVAVAGVDARRMTALLGALRLPERSAAAAALTQVSLRLYDTGRDHDAFRAIAAPAVLLWLGDARDVAYAGADSDRTLRVGLAGHGTAHVFEGDAVDQHYRVRVPERTRHTALRIAVLFFGAAAVYSDA